MWVNKSLFATSQECNLSLSPLSVQICQFFANLHAASADVYRYNDSCDPEKIRPSTPPTLGQLAPCAHQFNSIKNLHRHLPLRVCLSWPFSSRTPLHFNSNLESVDFLADSWELYGGILMSVLNPSKGKSFSHLDGIANCAKSQSRSR